MPPTVRRLEPANIPACERVLRSLPSWFGFEAANQQYIRDLETLPAYVAELGGEVVGFLAIRQHTPVAAELHIIAVEPGHHRRGIGRSLLVAAEADLIAGGTVLLQVKTLGPSHPDEGYRKTRDFYAAQGFLSLEETMVFWGPEQPTLIMVKVLSPNSDATAR